MSEILDIANDMAKDLFKVGAIDEITLRKVEALDCLQNTVQAEDIRRHSHGKHASQELLAILGMRQRQRSTGEQGRRSQAAAQRLLDLVDRKGLAVLA